VLLVYVQRKRGGAEAGGEQRKKKFLMGIDKTFLNVLFFFHFLFLSVAFLEAQRQKFCQLYGYERYFILHRKVCGCVCVLEIMML
jgi:hypothetical protein